MRSIVATALPLALSLALTPCQKSWSQTQQESSKPPAAAPSTAAAQADVDIDACSLLTKEELAAVQGCAFTGAQGSANAQGEFRVSQCVYHAEELSKSVSLVVMGTKSGGAKPRTVKQFWHETFDRFSDAEKDKDRGTAEKTEKRGAAAESRGKNEEEEKEKPPPLRLDGLGDNAFWASTHVGGTLYVLKGETLVRLSVGGPGTDNDRMEKSRRLAEKALTRL